MDMSTSTMHVKSAKQTRPSLTRQPKLRVAKASSNREKKASVDDWQRAMRAIYDRRQIDEQDRPWPDRMSEFLEACKSWLRAMSASVDGIAVQQRERWIFLIVVLKRGVEPTLEFRRAVSDFGNTIGAACGLLIEARFSASYPSDFVAVVNHAVIP